MESKCILIVDDDDITLKLVENRLTEEGFTVIQTKTSQEAVKTATEKHPDLILMDILLPDLDGPETVKMLKSTPATQDIPVIFLSGIAEASSDGESIPTIKIGNHFLPAVSKPIDFEKLLYAISTSLNG